VALAKRQRTFFRRDPRIHWIPWHHEPDERLQAALSHLEESWTS
jgi:tRNA A37 N6-isopentenylltransferase MiaA